MNDLLMFVIFSNRLVGYYHQFSSFYQKPPLANLSLVQGRSHCREHLRWTPVVLIFSVCIHNYNSIKETDSEIHDFECGPVIWMY